MQKQIKILLTILMALVLAVSCAKNNPNDPNNNQTEKPAWKQNPNYQSLIQDWQNPKRPTEVYQIREKDNSTIDFNALNEGTGEVGYSINVSEIVWNADNTSGIMYGTYTKIDETWQKPEVLNKWYAILFNKLTADTLYISQAYVTPSADAPDGSYTETLEKAKEIFTEANNAFSTGSDLVPQTK